MGDGDGGDAYDDRDRIGSSSDTDETDQHPDEDTETENIDDTRSDHGDESGSDHGDEPTSDHGDGSASNRGTSGSQHEPDDSSPGRKSHESVPPAESRPSTDDSARDSALSSNADSRSSADSSSSGGSRSNVGSRSSGGSEERAATDEQVTIEDDGIVRWFFKTDDGTVLIVRDILTSVAIVAIIGLILFGISGIWPPLVAVESGSMDPNMKEGDLIFVVDDDRFVGDDPVDGTGVVTLENGQESGHDKFGMYGDVVVFQPGGSETATPVIHRAHFWVDEGDDWVAQADPEIIGDDTCDDVRTCPAEHEGFITKGDNNAGYDQQANAGTQSDNIVRPEWVTGKASFRIPWLGNIRLLFDDYLLGIAGGSAPITPEAIGAVSIGASGLAGTAAVAGKRRFGRY